MYDEAALDHHGTVNYSFYRGMADESRVTRHLLFRAFDALTSWFMCVGLVGCRIGETFAGSKRR
jgi:hypothetical protein